MASANTVYMSQVDGLLFTADPAGAIAPDLVVASAVTITGLQISYAVPAASQTIKANGCAYIFGQAYRVAAGVVITIQAGAILRVEP